MPKVIRTDKKGLRQKTGKGAVGIRYWLQTELTANSAATAYTTPDAAGVKQPPKSVLVDVAVLTTTALAYASGTSGVRVGTAEAGAQLMALDADSLKASSTTVAAGKGTSTHGSDATSMGGVATLVVVADSGYSAAGRTVYPQVVASAGSITAGKLQCWMEFMQYDTDA